MTAMRAPRSILLGTRRRAPNLPRPPATRILLGTRGRVPNLPRCATRIAGALLAAAFAVSCGGDGGGTTATPTGIRVELDLGAFTDTVQTLKLTVSAATAGFRMIDPGNTAVSMPAPGVQLATQASTANPDALDLVMTFSRPDGYGFPQPMVFRIETSNSQALQVSAVAVATNDLGKRIASGISAAAVTLAIGGQATLSLTLEKDDGNVTPGTPTLDLSMAGADIAIQGPQANGGLSSVVVCDVNKDNKSDVIVGVPAAVTPAGDATGAVYIVFGGKTEAVVNLAAPTAGQENHLFGENAGDQLGAALACADIDNDGIPDLIIGAPGAYGAPGQEAAGRVYVIFGRTNLATSTVDISSADIVWIGPAAHANLGQAVMARDLDFDYAADVLISAPGDGAGVVHLLSVGAGWPTRPTVLGAASSPVTFSGAKVTAMAAGDLDGNGGDSSAAPFEVILGEPTYQIPGGDLRGAVYVFKDVVPGAARAFDVTATGALGPTLKLVGGTKNASFGAALASLNLSTDGDDLVVGAPGSNDGAGAVYLYGHNANFFQNSTPDPTRSLPGPAANGRFGSALAGVLSGNLDAPSGFQLLVGAPSTDNAALSQAGAAYVYRNFRDPSPELVVQIFGAEMRAHLGAAVAGGQVDANKIGDVVVVAPDATGGAAAAGAGVAYVRFGQ